MQVLFQAETTRTVFMPHFTHSIGASNSCLMMLFLLLRSEITQFNREIGHESSTRKIILLLPFLSFFLFPGTIQCSSPSSSQSSLLLSLYIYHHLSQFFQNSAGKLFYSNYFEWLYDCQLSRRNEYCRRLPDKAPSVLLYIKEVTHHVALQTQAYECIFSNTGEQASTMIQSQNFVAFCHADIAA